MNSVIQFLHMGGYAPYVWGSYGVAAIVLLANLRWSRRRHKNVVDQTKRWLNKVKG